MVEVKVPAVHRRIGITIKSPESVVFKADALSFEPIFINFPHWGELGERAVLRPPRCAEFSAYIDRSNSGHIEAHA